jgi:hypothetical protein
MLMVNIGNGRCLQDGIGFSKDLKGAAYYFKRCADQGNSDGQCCYGRCFRDGIAISKNLKGAADYCTLSPNFFISLSRVDGKNVTKKETWNVRAIHLTLKTGYR